MVIKTLRWKVAGFGRLIEYVGKELVNYVGKDDTRSLEILHNLHYTNDLNDIARQFAENDAYRKQRKGGVTMYHEILSFHAHDRDAITPETLEDITREYLRIRAPNALAYAAPHYDRDHVHVHIAISGVEFRSSKTLRMNNRTFASVRRQIEHYQLTKYPELEHSIVHLTKHVRSSELQKDIEKERPLIDQCYEQAQSLDDFYDRVAQAGIDESKYSLDPTTHRFSFDIDLTRLMDLDERMRKLQALQDLRQSRETVGLRSHAGLNQLIEDLEHPGRAIGQIGDKEINAIRETSALLDPAHNAQAQDLQAPGLAKLVYGAEPAGSEPESPADSDTSGEQQQHEDTRRQELEQIQEERHHRSPKARESRYLSP